MTCVWLNGFCFYPFFLTRLPAGWVKSGNPAHTQTATTTAVAYAGQSHAEAQAIISKVRHHSTHVTRHVSQLYAACKAGRATSQRKKSCLERLTEQPELPGIQLRYSSRVPAVAT